MKNLFGDSRFRLILLANLASSIGSGITMIAIPWLLVTSENGSEVFGYITLTMTAISFIITPLIGQLIDRMSRKNLLLISKIVSLIVIGIFSFSGFLGLSFETWHYIIIYFTGSLYYTIFYPTMFALNQELFTSSQYKSLNGTMEVQGQLSSVIAGGVASLLLVNWGIHQILLLNVAAYMAAILLFIRIPYIKRSKKNQSEATRSTENAYTYIKNQPALFYVLLLTTMPFIGVMVTNYMFPVYLAEVLKASGSIYGIKEMMYAIGAVTAGLIMPLVMVKLGPGRAMIYGMIIYTLAISLVLLVNIPVFLALMFFIAIGNSGTRVARNSFMMDQIPNHMIGRIDGLFRTIGLMLRMVLLGLFTGLVSAELIMVCFNVLSLVMVISVAGIVVAWRRVGVESRLEKRVNTQAL
ncbi:MFS transporter [Jeotgalibacillus sp. R-1-5s-1]|uniref:MFS transporter n=1 Tax=Jeotgalibacillus sp. R-1-5s-1 TaxID=2555897 RepID=UPI00106C79B6|nr:MFS transporter [Jeotgalibacillus sp. R-1-5s-1]TFD94428.1 MFS transporter [Jeotgalibacillus sp. R-1-5s-1]